MCVAIAPPCCTATATASATHHEGKEEHRGRPKKHEEKHDEEPVSSTAHFPTSHPSISAQHRRHHQLLIHRSAFASVCTPAPPQATVTDYVNRYGGWYPLIGLGAVIALSKELLVLNEEFLMVSNFAAFVFISWLAVGDTVNDMVKDKAEAIRKNHDDVSDLYIDSLEAVIKAGENSLATLPLMRQLKTEYGTLGQQVIRAKELKARAAAREAVLQRLNQVYQKEQNEKAKYLAAVYDNAYQQVQERLAGMSEQEKSRMIDSAIAMIGGSSEEAEDPVARIYQEVLNNRQSGQSAQRPAAGQGAQQRA